MAWEESTLLGQAAPPGLLIVATASDVDSWTELGFDIPTKDPQSFVRRRLLHMTMRAVSSAATSQILATQFITTHTFIVRKGQTVTPHIQSSFFGHYGVASSDSEGLPICQWVSPFNFPLRGGDCITVNIPGDANASPTQDWRLEMLFGAELKR